MRAWILHLLAVVLSFSRSLLWQGRPYVTAGGWSSVWCDDTCCTCRGGLEGPRREKVVLETAATRACPQSAVGCLSYSFSFVLAMFLWDVGDFWKEDGKGWMDYCQNNSFDQQLALEKKAELLTGSLWPRGCRWGSLVLQIMFPVLHSLYNGLFRKIKGIFWIAVSYMVSNVS